MNDDNHATTGKTPKPFWKSCLILTVMVAVLAIFIVAISLSFQIPTKEQAELEIEFKLIAPMPSAKLVKHSSTHNIGKALVTADYVTNAASADIFKYYDEQLKQHGWQFQGTEAVTDWDRDLGGKSADYCKGDYGAELQYAGEKAHYGWTYAFDVNWNFTDCKTKK